MIHESADTCTYINISYQWRSACASTSQCRAKRGRQTHFRVTGFNNRILKCNGTQGNFLHVAVSREKNRWKVQFVPMLRSKGRSFETHRGVLEQNIVPVQPRKTDMAENTELSETCTQHQRNQLNSL